MADPKHKNHTNELKKIGAFAVLTAIFVAGAYLLNFWGDDISESSDDWGQFGDYIGGLLNPVFSFAALIALLWTINLQIQHLEVMKEELKNSRTELQLTRSELEKSTEALASQAKIQDSQYEQMQIESFSNNFFKMLDQLVTNMDKVELQGSHNSSLFSNFAHIYNKIVRQITTGIEFEDHELIHRQTQKWIDNHESYSHPLKMHINLLKNLLGYLASQPQPYDKSFYVHSAIAQFSETSLLATFLCVQCDKSRDQELVDLVSRFAFFRNLDRQHWQHPDSLQIHVQLEWKPLSDQAFGLDLPS